MAANQQTKGNGRKAPRTEVKFIENKQERLISFTKRRFGIFKKANELVSTCGGEVGVVVYSPAGRAFSFCNPSMEAIASRFLGVQISDNEPEKNGEDDHPLSEEQRKEKIDKMNKVHIKMMRRIEEDKMIERMMKQHLQGSSSNEERLWWEIPSNEFNYQQLKEVNNRLAEISGIVMKKVEQKKKAQASGSC